MKIYNHQNKRILYIIRINLRRNQCNLSFKLKYLDIIVGKHKNVRYLPFKFKSTSASKLKFMEINLSQLNLAMQSW